MSSGHTKKRDDCDVCHDVSTVENAHILKYVKGYQNTTKHLCGDCHAKWDNIQESIRNYPEGYIVRSWVNFVAKAGAVLTVIAFLVYLFV